MFDSYNRHINYLRISVTDRCNLRCRYCVPESGRKMLAVKDILSNDEIIHFTGVAAGFGISKVRLTGGEPLLRENIAHLVKNLSKIKGIKEVTLTTNGIRLAQLAKPLADAGLKRVNVSLDSIDPENYKIITRGGNLLAALKGIDAALDAGLTPVKLNCVIKKSSEEPDAAGVKKFGENMGLQVRFIREMNLLNGTFYQVEGGEGGNCAQCNRLRLTANGLLRPCLFNNLSYNIREYGAEQAFMLAIENKPACGTINHVNEFYNIGG